MSIASISRIADPLVRRRFITTEIEGLERSMSRCSRPSSIAERRAQIRGLIALR